DPAFDLFEDWDFLIRLAQRAAFTHIPRVTCEIRHIEGAGSITMSIPAGSQRFRDAKLQIWRKHAAFIDHDTIANVFEREKQRALRTESERNELLIRIGELGDARGAFDEAQRTIAALYAEIGRLQTTLDSIFQSRTWKLHAMVEKMKGR